jgi:hypothetical protein
VDGPPGATEPVAHSKVDFATNYASNYVRAIDAGEPITLLAGVNRATWFQTSPGF